MPYVGPTFVNGTSPAINATNLNNIARSLEKAVLTDESRNIGEGTISFDEVIDASSSGTATIDFSAGQKHVITLTEDTTLSFIAPSGECHLQLRVVQNGTGGWALTLPTYYTPGAEPYDGSTDANAEDILSIYYDGSRYIVSPLYDIGVVV
jgi:hypothetical protein